jgi:hypothetical protein
LHRQLSVLQKSHYIPNYFKARACLRNARMDGCLGSLGCEEPGAEYDIREHGRYDNECDEHDCRLKAGECVFRVNVFHDFHSP